MMAAGALRALTSLNEASHAKMFHCYRGAKCPGAFPPSATSDFVAAPPGSQQAESTPKEAWKGIRRVKRRKAAFEEFRHCEARFKTLDAKLNRALKAVLTGSLRRTVRQTYREEEAKGRHLELPLHLPHEVARPPGLTGPTRG